jgi:hypothetical protein
MIHGKVSIEMGGEIYAGTWRVERETITVSSSAGTKRAKAGDFVKKPASLARMMLRETVTERRGNL